MDLRHFNEGPTLVIDPSLYEYTDPRNEAAVVTHWAPVLASIGAQVLGVRDVPQRPHQIDLDGIPWTVELLTEGRHRVPASAFERISQASELGIPITYWLRAKEHVPQPTFEPGEPRPAPARQPVRRRLAPLRTVALRPQGDPLIYGVIATAPYRGLFAVFAKYQD